MAFDGDTFLVREHVGFMKLHEAFDILTAEGALVGTAIERASGLRKFLKLFVNKQLLPCEIDIVSGDEHGPTMLSLRRGFTFLRAKVRVYDASGTMIGYFRSRLFSLGGAFDVLDASDRQIAVLQGDWKGWNFTFKDTAGTELGQVTKKWGGLAKELFTSADTYVVHIEREKLKGSAELQLLLAAGICIDIVLKEQG